MEKSGLEKFILEVRARREARALEEREKRVKKLRAALERLTPEEWHLLKKAIKEEGGEG